MVNDVVMIVVNDVRQFPARLRSYKILPFVDTIVRYWYGPSNDNHGLVRSYIFWREDDHDDEDPYCVPCVSDRRPIR